MDSPNNPEIERIAKKLGDEYRYMLTHPDFVAFESVTGVATPHSLRNLYSNAQLLLSAPGHFVPDVWIQEFTPLVPHNEMISVGGRKLISLAAGWDSDSFFCELTGDLSSVPLHVHWDDRPDRRGVLHPDDFEDLGITLEELLVREWRPFAQ